MMAPLDPSQLNPSQLNPSQPNPSHRDQPVNATSKSDRSNCIYQPAPNSAAMLSISANAKASESPCEQRSRGIHWLASLIPFAFPNSPTTTITNRGYEIQSIDVSQTESNNLDANVTDSAARSTGLENLLIGLWNFTSGSVYFLGSVFGVTFVLAWIATIPVVQLLTLGFLVEVTNRVIHTGRLRDGIVGREKGWFLFKLLLGISLSLVPLYLASNMRFDAWLISPGSQRYHQLLRWETGIFIFTILHLLGAGLCGASLRHFLWPVLMPWYIGAGCLKWILSRSIIRGGIEATFGKLFPRTTQAYFRSQPLSHWFVPAVLWRHIRRGTLISASSQSFWEFIVSLRLVHYAKQGFGALIGVTLWFAGPTFWIVTSTRSINPGVQGICYLLFLLHLFLVLLYFPFAHTRYCKTLNIRSYFQWRKAGRTFHYSPMRLTIAMLFSLLLSTPLWFMRIAMVPYDLWWVFSIFYIALLWPAWMLWGWGTHNGDYEAVTSLAVDEPTGMTKANESGPPAPVGRRCSFAWIWSWRTIFVALVFVQLFITVLSIYVCWQGAFNVLLHPMFNIPTPFGPNA